MKQEQGEVWVGSMPPAGGITSTQTFYVIDNYTTVKYIRNVGTMGASTLGGVLTSTDSVYFENPRDRGDRKGRLSNKYGVDMIISVKNMRSIVRGSLPRTVTWTWACDWRLVQHTCAI